MSLIEKAVERLDALRSRTDAGAHSATPAALSDASVPAHVGAGTRDSTVASRPRTPDVTINLDQLASAGYVTPNFPKSLVSEEFRVIKRPLLTNIASPAAPIRNANLIMVTSSLPGEGKTFSAVNLAMSIATELDRTVLLVDADVARPSLPRVLGLPDGKGLLDVVQDKSIALGDVLLRTNIEKLSVITAGTRDMQSTELLASESMGNLLTEMAQRYSDRVIIFDAPPLLVTTEARVLASRVGQVVFVVRAEETPKNAVKEALATIEQSPIKLLILNQARNVQNVAYGYSYGYGY